MTRKNILFIVIGVIAVAAIIYLVATTDFSSVARNGNQSA